MLIVLKVIWKWPITFSPEILVHVLSCGQFFLNVFVAPPPPTAFGLVKPEYYATLGMMRGREQKKNRKRKLKSKLI